MTDRPVIHQQPAAGERLLKACGDALTFRVRVDPPKTGSAFIRTNIGSAHRTRRETIDEVDRGQAKLGTDWFDIPMRPIGEGEYEVTVGLSEPGHFEAKCLFIPDGDAGTTFWPPGTNTAVNVLPAACSSSLTIYNAFVRQFGPAKHATPPLGESQTDVVAELDGSGYTVIPPSGTFRDLIEELDFIIGHLGCRIIQLLPVHPTPTTYARMGRFGSPFAALSFTAVDPAQAVFDPSATPLEQFLELVDGVHRRGARICLDIAINHTGWAASLHETHPEWLVRDETGRIEMPGAWGVTWADLTRLDYRHRDLWRFMADVFLLWCRRGIDGFRCDAGYMIPIDAWRYIISRVREQFPDTIFLLEGLGGGSQRHLGAAQQRRFRPGVL